MLPQSQNVPFESPGNNNGSKCCLSTEFPSISTELWGLGSHSLMNRAALNCAALAFSDCGAWGLCRCMYFECGTWGLCRCMYFEFFTLIQWDPRRTAHHPLSALSHPWAFNCAFRAAGMVRPAGVYFRLRSLRLTSSPKRSGSATSFSQR